MRPTNQLKSVLIADDDDGIVELLTRRCEALGLKVDAAGNAMTALGKIEQDEPDAVLLDLDLPQGNGLSVCEMMAGHERLHAIPVVMLTGDSSETTIRRCHELCAYYVQKCPDVWSRVEPLLCELLEIEPPAPATAASSAEPADGVDETGPLSTDLVDTVFAVLGVEDDISLADEAEEQEEARGDKPWVLSIEDDDDVALALKLRLEAHGVTLIRATEGAEGYRKAFFSSPAAILLDYELPNGNGDYVLRRLKETPTIADIPVIVLTGRREAAIERQMRGLGAAEYLTKPFNWNELRTVLDAHLDAATPC